MFQEDIDKITSWVLQYPDLETGGSLFGLWKDERNPISHITLGPGQKCRRTPYSFFQDISYLERVGNMLTRDYMLCHIGEWHSHHRLGLYQPSGGDVSTVVRNFPTGVCAFLLMIVNIISPYEVKLSPYMFTGNSIYYHGDVVAVSGRSPFRIIQRITEHIRTGEEVPRSGFERRTFTLQNYKEKRGNKRIDVKHLQDPVTKITNYRPTKPNRLLKSRNTYKDGEDYSESFHQETPQLPPAVDVSTCTSPRQWYTKTAGQEILKEIYERLLQEHPDTTDYKISRDSSTQNLFISFNHHNMSWIFEFPPNFPVGKPVLKKAVSTLRRRPISRYFNTPLTSSESKIIPEMVKKNCSRCKTRTSRPNWCF